MGFTKPYLPDVDPDTFLEKPLMERMRILATDWAEHGFGSPKMIHTIYIVKLVVFFALGGITIATLTSGLPAFWHVSEWWNQPIVQSAGDLGDVTLHPGLVIEAVERWFLHIHDVRRGCRCSIRPPRSFVAP